MKVSAKQSEVRVLEGERVKTPKQHSSRTVTPMSVESGRSEVYLRGMMAEEAVAVTERFIDTASMRHIEEVRIIHGKGTGVLRDAVQKALKRNPQVKSFRLGRFGEGEAGVTVVTLK